MKTQTKVVVDRLVVIDVRPCTCCRMLHDTFDDGTTANHCPACGRVRRNSHECTDPWHDSGKDGNSQ